MNQESPSPFPIGKDEIAAHLADKYPHLFIIPVPLKVGIRADLLSSPDRKFSSRALCSFLHKWVASPAYCYALSRAKCRYDLDGAMAPLVTNDTRGISPQGLY